LRDWWPSRKSVARDSKEIANPSHIVEALTLSAWSVTESRRKLCR